MEVKELHQLEAEVKVQAQRFFAPIRALLETLDPEPRLLKTKRLTREIKGLQLSLDPKRALTTAMGPVLRILFDLVVSELPEQGNRGFIRRLATDPTFAVKPPAAAALREACPTLLDLLRDKGREEEEQKGAAAGGRGQVERSIAEMDQSLIEQFDQMRVTIHPRPGDDTHATFLLTQCSGPTAALIRSTVFFATPCVRFTAFHAMELPSYRSAEEMQQFLGQVQVWIDANRLRLVTPCKLLFQLRVEHAVADGEEKKGSARAEPAAPIDRELMRWRDKLDADGVRLLGKDHWQSGSRAEPPSLTPNLSIPASVERQLRRVKLSEFQWIPLGFQEEELRPAPRLLDQDLEVAILVPGDHIFIQAVATIDCAIATTDGRPKDMAGVARATHHAYYQMTPKSEAVRRQIKEDFDFRKYLHLSAVARTGEIPLTPPFRLTNPHGADLLDRKAAPQKFGFDTADQWGHIHCGRFDPWMLTKRESSAHDSWVLTISTTGNLQAVSVFEQTMRFLVDRCRDRLKRAAASASDMEIEK